MSDHNQDLAFFITSFGSLNDYGSTLTKTKQALDHHDASYLDEGGPEDQALFQDALDGIAAAQKAGFTVEGIKAINRSFVHSEAEDPTIPGHLRNSLYNTDDNISVNTNRHLNSHQGLVLNTYFPPEVVTNEMLQAIIDQYHASLQTQIDQWRVFADLAKLQPFQDGNKRTASIAANAASHAIDTHQYLVLPLNALDHSDFINDLMRYYQTDNDDQSRQNELLNKMVALVPNQAAQQQLWQQQQDLTKPNNSISTRKIIGKPHRHRHKL